MNKIQNKHKPAVKGSKQVQVQVQAGKNRVYWTDMSGSCSVCAVSSYVLSFTNGGITDSREQGPGCSGVSLSEQRRLGWAAGAGPRLAP